MMAAMKPLYLVTLLTLATTMQTPTTEPLTSRVVDWNTMTPTPTRTGQRRNVFDAPTGTLDKLHGHITTLNPGEKSGEPSKHLQEEVIIVKEGSVEANWDGKSKIGGPGSVIYAAAKGFIATATRGWAKELVRDRIRVNAVSPGVIMTPFHERYSTAEQLAAMQTTIPMDRLGTPDECVGAFLYLASEALSGYVTGQIIEVNGGQYMP